MRPAFHLAIPVNDLAVARTFYGEVLGLSEGRRSDFKDAVGNSLEFKSFSDESQVFAA